MVRYDRLLGAFGVSNDFTQRRRVTVGEMTTSRQPVLCGDEISTGTEYLRSSNQSASLITFFLPRTEISTGLDAASTFDMVEVLTYFGRLSKMTRIFALLQPSPETVSLFDEVILMGKGRILYAGPIHEVEQYFADLGYKSPQFMDVADFLQTVSTEHGKSLYRPDDGSLSTAPTVSELADLFKSSVQGKAIAALLKEEPPYVWTETDETKSSSLSGLALLQQVRQRYANSFLRNCYLNLRRFFTLWTRDKRVIIASAIKNILMGVSVGGVFSTCCTVFFFLPSAF